MLTIKKRCGNGIIMPKVFEDVDILRYLTKTCRRLKKGLIVARVNYEKKKVHIGWSLCNTTAGDTFNKERGLEIATGRMENFTVKLEKDCIDEFLFKHVPQSLHFDMKLVFNRCERMLNADKKRRKKKED